MAPGQGKAAEMNRLDRTGPDCGGLLLAMALIYDVPVSNMNIDERKGGSRIYINSLIRGRK